MPKQPKFRMVRFPKGFIKYPAGRTDLDGSVEVDLGRWEDANGVSRQFHLRVEVASLPRLIEAILKSPANAKTLYESLHVFRVAESR